MSLTGPIEVNSVIDPFREVLLYIFILTEMLLQQKWVPFAVFGLFRTVSCNLIRRSQVMVLVIITGIFECSISCIRKSNLNQFTGYASFLIYILLIDMVICRLNSAFITRSRRFKLGGNSWWTASQML